MTKIGAMARNAWDTRVPPLRYEAHFGNRVVPCFAQRPASLNELFQQAVTMNPQGEALVDGERRYTWQALSAKVEALAGGLAAHGVQPGDRVALLLDNSEHFPCALFAVARLGAVSVPIGHRSQRDEVAYVLDHCGAHTLIHDAELADRVPTRGQCPALSRRLVAGSSSTGQVGVESQDLAGGPSLPLVPVQADLASQAPTQVNEESVAVILYTSGTTGRPKGAMLTHLNLVHAAMTYQVTMGLSAKDRSIIAVPMSHVTGLAALILTVTRCASTLIIMRAFKAPDFLALAARERMTHTLLVPAMYNLCLLQSDFAAHDLSSWRVGGFGGAPMPPATVERLSAALPDLGLMNAYGATETVVAVAQLSSHDVAAHPDRVGRAVPGVDLLVMDDRGCATAPGELGEVWIRGPSVVAGYWQNPEATAREFVAGFWRSGDVGTLDAEGRLAIVDRQKDMINRGGYKVFTTEVENVLCAHASVLECAVVAKPCPVLGERVHAVVTLKSDLPTGQAQPSRALLAELRAHCAARLSDYKVPESFSLLTQPLPRNANGKVLKRDLRDRLASGELEMSRP